MDLALDIKVNGKDYNSLARTFGNAMREGGFNSMSDISPELKEFRNELNDLYPNLNIKTISVQKRGSNFDIEPSMKIE